VSFIQVCKNKVDLNRSDGFDYLEGNGLKHKPGLYYCATRTQRGFTRGIHYWEISIRNCTIDAYNSYIGIATKNMAKADHLGSTGDDYIEGFTYQYSRELGNSRS
jgi:hypothetical protein